MIITGEQNECISQNPMHDNNVIFAIAGIQHNFGLNEGAKYLLCN